jgi:hypothetical protein
VSAGPSCPGCGLPNYEGLCPHCRGDQDAYERELVPPFETSIPTESHATPDPLEALREALGNLFALDEARFDAIAWAAVQEVRERAALASGGESRNDGIEILTHATRRDTSWPDQRTGDALGRGEPDPVP